MAPEAPIALGFRGDPFHGLEVAAATPTFAGVSFKLLDEVGSVQWPCNPAAPLGTPVMYVGTFVRGKGQLIPTPYVLSTERSTRRFPLLLTTGATFHTDEG